MSNQVVGWISTASGIGGTNSRAWMGVNMFLRDTIYHFLIPRFITNRPDWEDPYAAVLRGKASMAGLNRVSNPWFNPLGGGEMYIFAPFFSLPVLPMMPFGNSMVTTI